MSSTVIAVDIVSDVVCPWYVIGIGYPPAAASPRPYAKSNSQRRLGAAWTILWEKEGRWRCHRHEISRNLVSVWINLHLND